MFQLNIYTFFKNILFLSFYVFNFLNKLQFVISLQNFVYKIF